MPQGVHTWAQSDRYALAIGYLNGDPILEPTTYALFTENGRVGVEFSGTAWLSAKIATIFDAKDLLPGIFRMLSALWVILSLWLCGRLILGSEYVLRVVFALFCLSSPVLGYYAFNFIPDAHGFAFALTGITFYMRFLRQSEIRFLLPAMVLCGLAGLFKLSSAIYLIAIAGHQTWLYIQKKGNSVYFILTGLISSALLAGVAFYDYQYFIKVNKELWSAVFMSAPNPVRSFKELSDVWIGIVYWRSEYFHPAQYLILLFCLISGVMHFKKMHVYRSFTILIFTGFLGFLWGLGKQLIHHDYYVISVFYPFIFIVFAIGLRHYLSTYPVKIKALIGIIFTIFYFQSSEKITARTGEVYTFRKGEIRSDIAWLKNGKNILDSVGIGAHEKIFVLYDFAPNTSLVYLDRKGMVFNHEQMSRKEPHLEYWIDRIKPEHFVVPNLWNDQFEKDKPILKDSLNAFKTTNFTIYSYRSHGHRILP